MTLLSSTTGPNWRDAWENHRDEARTVIVLMFESCGRNLRKTSEALKMSLSTLQRFRREDAALRDATQVKPGRPSSKGAANATTGEGERRRAVGE